MSGRMQQLTINYKLLTIEIIMDYDVKGIREKFPILSRKIDGKPLIYLDNTATSQTPRSVVEAVVSGYCDTKANVHRGGLLYTSDAADEL